MTLPLRRGVPIVAGCFVAMVAAVLAAPFIGSTSLTFSRVFTTSVRSYMHADIHDLQRVERAGGEGDVFFANRDIVTRSGGVVRRRIAAD